MASLDVTNLFTQIPLVETIQICTDQLFQTPDTKVAGLSRTDFKHLLELAVKENHFIFNKQLYDQMDGVAMGSPLGPTLANSFLCFHEAKWLANCPAEFKPILYRRYVDDTFVLFKSTDHVSKFQEYMNSQHANIKFTSEIERNGKLPFLDVLVEQKGQAFCTSIFRKNTFTGLYSKFDSFLPLQYKVGLIRTLLVRAFRICSNYECVHDEFTIVKNLLEKNGFPLSILDRVIKKFWLKMYCRKPSIQGCSKFPVLICLPFTGVHCLDLRSKISRFVRNYYPQASVRFVFQTKRRIRNLFVYKDRLPLLLRSGVVYKFECSGCSATYIGKTKRHLKTRVYEHLGVSVRTGRTLSSPPDSAVRDHALHCGHPLEIANFSVLECAPSNYDLSIYENLLISKFQPSLNTMSECSNMLLF